MKYEDYRSEFLASVYYDATLQGISPEEEFLRHALNTLSDYDEISDSQRLFLKDKRCSNQRKFRVDGYCFDETDSSLILFINDFHDTENITTLTMTGIDELYWKLFYFLDDVYNDKISEYISDDPEATKIVRLMRLRLNALSDDARLILKIKMIIISSRELDTYLLDKDIFSTSVSRRKSVKRSVKASRKIKKPEFYGKPLEVSIWTIERLYELEATNCDEPIIIDFATDFQCHGIPCIKGDIGEGLGYDAYIAIIPGKLLADIFIEFGSRILEGNVRAFLGTSNAKGINAGIKRTINTDPTKFFTYNNGIAATAIEVETKLLNDQMYITNLVDLQIINGGQTTATLAEAVLKKTNVDLAGVFVPMKLTVIDDHETENQDGIRFYDEMVHSIAKFANSQNKITAADLFSNDPFHVFMEKISKKQLAPPVKAPIPTGWYYERSRKKYQQEQVKLRGDELTRFLMKFPKEQIITKEQLAMYLTTIAGKPHVVSKGKTWTMKEFGADIGKEFRENKNAFNDSYFKKCVCAAIIFRTVDNYLESNKKNPEFWYNTGGYKQNLVPYAISKILHLIPAGLTLDWNQIWATQTLSPAFLFEISIATKEANDFFCSNIGVLVSEFAKKEETWVQFRDNNHYKLSREFIDELIPTKSVLQQEKSIEKELQDTNELFLVSQIIEAGTHYWKQLLDNGVQRNLLSAQEQFLLRQAIDWSYKGVIPCTSSGRIPARTLALANTIISIKNKIESEGITIDGAIKMIITDYRMKQG